MQGAKATIRQPPVIEVIACSVSDAIEAQRGGAGRLEIIRDFQRGGLTPPLDLVQNILNAVTLPVRVMLREGDSYDVVEEGERKQLCAAASQLSRLNVDGVVLGFLRQGEIDVQLTERVLSCAPNLAATFHHAFEEAKNRFTAIRVLKQVKQVDRILTSGGTGEWPEKIARLSRYQDEAGPEIEILAGGGIDQQSMRMICQATGIREFHLGRAAREPVSAAGVVRSERVKALVETAQECC
ncbi:MAG: copper homeostasis protein CutC [Pyrinomonadaceae bacterium]